MASPKLHLASSSPRRAELLRALNLSFSAEGVNIDETPLPGEAAVAMVRRLAAAKADAANVDRQTVVLGADTAVVLGDRVMGKPRDRNEAVEMLLSLAARKHQVVTGIAVKTMRDVQVEHVATDVWFRDIDQDEANLYWQSGEPADKAGGYGIQGLGGQFVESINGSYSGVVGLPVFETSRLLKLAGIDILAIKQ